MNYLHYLWLLIPILGAVFYKFTFRVFFGMVVIPEDRIGLVVKKFVLFGANKSLPDGKIIALNGEAGFQAETLAPGLYWGYWVWQYEVRFEKFINIEKGKIGLVMAKDGLELPTGRILARRVSKDADGFQNAVAFLRGGGQKGRQTSYLNSGTYRINTLLFEVYATDLVSIKEGFVGVVTALDGEPLDPKSIAGKNIKGHNNYQDLDTFLANGGQRGLQPEVILAGTYSLNPWGVQIEQIAMTEIAIGNVGVVISYVGEEGRDITGTDFKHGNIVENGKKGVWATPLDPGKYPINIYTHKVTQVPTTNLVLNWATGRNESHKLDANLSTITVRSKDGFPFNLDVSQIIHIPSTEAPKVIARFGSMANLVSQVLEPTIGNYFRNSAQNDDVISFLSARQSRQDAAKSVISSVLGEYNVHAVDTLIGDITPPEALMKTLTDRKIAQEEKTTLKTQEEAQDQRKMFESAKALAAMQPQMVQAQQSVEIAERTANASIKTATGDAKSIELRAEANAKAVKLTANAEAERIKVTGDAEASKILATGEATAKAYELQVAAMGGDNFANFKIMEEIGKNDVKLMPDVLIGGGANGEGGSAISGLLGLELLNRMQIKNASNGTNGNGHKPDKK